MRPVTKYVCGCVVGCLRHVCVCSGMAMVYAYVRWVCVRAACVSLSEGAWRWPALVSVAHCFANSRSSRWAPRCTQTDYNTDDTITINVYNSTTHAAHSGSASHASWHFATVWLLEMHFQSVSVEPSFFFQFRGHAALSQPWNATFLSAGRQWPGDGPQCA